MTPFYLQSAAILALNDKLSAQKFSAVFNKPYSLKWQKAEKRSVTFLDSFDGRLNNSGYTLTLDDQQLLLKSVKLKNEYTTEDWSQKSFPRRAQDFNNPGMAKVLEKILDVRNLSKILTLKLTARPFSILNSDLKTVARGHFLQCASSYPQINHAQTIIMLAPLRGYSVEVKELQKTFPAFKRYSIFTQAILSTYKIDLRDYSKPSYDLASKQNISEALFEILYKNFLIMRKNEQGIIDDIDIEFLHDYRVACRRMRSALSLIKNIIEPVALQMLKLDLKQRGRNSGPLRDLDVYLLREEEYKELLPDDWPQKDIHAIFVKLKSQRKSAHGRMVKMLKSAEYVDLVERWQHFFNNFEQHTVSDAPLLKTVSALVMRWFKRILNSGQSLTAKDPDEKFHNLRIACKKLRYLLEFFGPLYPKVLGSSAVRQLKKLQENLGEFNDYSVQIETLNQLLNRSVKPRINFVKTVAGLITVLDYKMHQLKNEFYTLFADFSSEKNIKLYNKIFG